jgi:hypothetical protein
MPENDPLSISLVSAKWMSCSTCGLIDILVIPEHDGSLKAHAMTADEPLFVCLQCEAPVDGPDLFCSDDCQRQYDHDMAQVPEWD